MTFWRYDSFIFGYEGVLCKVTNQWKRMIAFLRIDHILRIWPLGILFLFWDLKRMVAGKKSRRLRSIMNNQTNHIKKVLLKICMLVIMGVSPSRHLCWITKFKYVNKICPYLWRYEHLKHFSLSVAIILIISSDSSYPALTPYILHLSRCVLSDCLWAP